MRKYIIDGITVFYGGDIMIMTDEVNHIEIRININWDKRGCYFYDNLSKAIKFDNFNIEEEAPKTVEGKDQIEYYLSVEMNTRIPVEQKYRDDMSIIKGMKKMLIDNFWLPEWGTTGFSLADEEDTPCLI